MTSKTRDDAIYNAFYRAIRAGTGGVTEGSMWLTENFGDGPQDGYWDWYSEHYPQELADEMGF